MLGCDTIRTKDVRETHKLVIAHVANIRRIKNLEDCTIVLCLESNLAYEAQHIIHSLQGAGLKRWVCACRLPACSAPAVTLPCMCRLRSRRARATRSDG